MEFFDPNFDGYEQFSDYMDSIYGRGNWSTPFPEPWPKQYDFLMKFLGKHIQVSPELWAKLDMKL